MLHVVIMAGGSGTRFWPQSRQDLPKQLLPLAGERTMIQQTWDRCQNLVPAERMWVVTNARQSARTAEQLPELPTTNLIEEPSARNTAPCLALAALHLKAVDPDAVMLVLPADHVIEPIEQFEKAVRTAEAIVAQDSSALTLFGVPPDFPATGFGYIERSEPVADHAGGYKVASFREKPDRNTAEEYLRSGTYFWNCGIFLWRADTIEQQLLEFEPEIAEHLSKVEHVIGAAEYQSVLENEFPLCPSISIDYAVLERAENVFVIEAPFNWDDLGSWQALHRLLGTDEDGNTKVGSTVTLNTKASIIRTTDDHLVATMGVENCIIVHTPTATLVSSKEDENAVKQLVQAIREQGQEGYL